MLPQAKRPEERVVDPARDGQSHVSLIAPDGLSGLDAKIATIIAGVIAIFLERALHLADGFDSAATVVEGLVRIFVTAAVGDGCVSRQRETENRDHHDTKQAECFHIRRYGRAKISQISWKPTSSSGAGGEDRSKAILQSVTFSEESPPGMMEIGSQTL
jgi:hypothetical protein